MALPGVPFVLFITICVFYFLHNSHKLVNLFGAQHSNAQGAEIGQALEQRGGRKMTAHVQIPGRSPNHSTLSRTCVRNISIHSLKVKGSAGSPVSR